VTRHRTESDSPNTPGDEPGDGAPAPLEVDPRVVELEQELSRARDAHLRAEADLQNVRRRGARESDEAERRGEARSFGAYLQLLDDLSRALEAAAQAGEAPDSPLVAGVRLVLTRAGDELARLGVTRIDPHGEPFDPREHEALLSSPSTEHPAGHVAQVVAPGYRQGDRLLRPARVIVSHGPAAGSGDASGDDAPGGGSS
jgi:molecular chaperone GrpE